MGCLAYGSVPGTLLGPIPWELCAALWGVVLVCVAALAQAQECAARAWAKARLRKPPFHNHSPRSKYPLHGVQRLPLP